MAAMKSKRSFYRTRTAYSINRSVQPTVSKLQLDVQSARKETPNKTIAMSSQRPENTVLDRIIGRLKMDNEDQEILLMITPASRHASLYKLHVMQRCKQMHLGMITITAKELSHLKVSKAFQSYCIVFASRYINLLQSENIHGLLSCLDRKNCSQHVMLSHAVSFSNASYAGDYIKNEALEEVKFQNSFTQTEPDEPENLPFSLNDINTLLEDINRNLQPSKKDIKRFFCMAEQLNFSLVVRPELLWKTADIVDVKKDSRTNVLVESYLSGSSYLGCITLKDNDLLEVLDLYPRLLLNIHVVQDVLEITPLPKNFVVALKNVLGFLRVELLYDAFGEYLFDCFKNFTYL